ncbi:MAG: hypothetical protein HYR90_02940 [Candidatus Andersenbacteria bacterium]|nr:hypothetical protein [Candidatus Andersenbacteria bacterium]MBI3251114.1 hypothetical protein [Candidatus Andersenbacteria bacterium]
MTSLPAPLEQRVQRLLGSESAVAIDSTFVSIQEYQPFISDELVYGRFRQPDHWAQSTDPTGNDSDPVTGIRPEDAQSFCAWLSQKSSETGEARFRPPQLNEVAPSDKAHIVPWVTVGGATVLAADAYLQQQWEQELFQQMQEGFDTDLSCDFDLPLHRRVSKNTVRDAALERARNRNQNSPLQRRLRERSTTLNRIWSVNPDSFPDAALRLQRMLRRICRRWPNLSFYLELARDLDRAIREADELSLIRPYLLCVHTAWDCCCMDIGEKDVGSPLLADFQQEVEHSFDLYSYVAMIDQRRKGQLPCREALQLVCEHPT